MDLLGGIGRIADTAMSWFNADKNRRQQEEFAKSGIQWRVEDAKKAGIHPLYAMGANTASFSPVSIGSDLGGAGDSLDRAVSSTMSGEHKAASKVLQTLAIERAQLQNDQLKLDLLASRDKMQNQAGTAKPIPSGGLVPQESSVDANPRVMFGGREIAMDPNFSPGKTYEDAWSDAGMLPAAYKMTKDLERTYGKSFGAIVYDWLNYGAGQLARTTAGSNAWKYDYDPRVSKRHPAADPRSKW